MQPCFLCLPTPGDRTASRIRRKAHLMALRYLLTLPDDIVPGQRGAMAALKRGLLVDSKRDSQRVLAAIGSPDVLPLIGTAMFGARGASDVVAAAVPNLLVALGRLAESVLWDAPVPRLMIGAGHIGGVDGVLCDPSGVGLRIGGQLVSLPDAPLTVFPELGHGVHLALADSFPLSLEEAHPDKAGNAWSLGERPVDDWVDALSAAVELVAEALPDWAAELPGTLRRLVPVGFEPRVHLSASYREGPGVAWLTLHPNRLTLAEAIVHETQHGKLNALTWLDPVLDNGHSVWTESPVRPDMRPLMGVLLAVHAFIPVAAMHQVLRQRDFEDMPFLLSRSEAVLQSNGRGLQVLEEKAVPTPAGARLISEMRAVHDALVSDFQR